MIPIKLISLTASPKKRAIKHETSSTTQIGLNQTQDKWSSTFTHIRIMSKLLVTGIHYSKLILLNRFILYF